MPAPRKFPDFLRIVGIDSVDDLVEALESFYTESTARSHALKYLRGEGQPGVVKTIRDEVMLQARHKGMLPGQVDKLGAEALKYGKKDAANDDALTDETKNEMPDGDKGGLSGTVKKEPALPSPPPSTAVAIPSAWLERKLEDSDYLAKRPEICIQMKSAGLDSYGIIVEKLASRGMSLDHAITITDRFFAGQVLKRPELSGDMISGGAKLIVSLFKGDPENIFAQDIERHLGGGKRGFPASQPSNG